MYVLKPTLKTHGVDLPEHAESLRCSQTFRFEKEPGFPLGRGGKKTLKIPWHVWNEILPPLAIKASVV